MYRRTARGNRVGLALTGLVLLAAGAALLAAHQGLYGSAGKRDVLYPASARRFVHTNAGWLWPVVAGAAIVLGLVFLRWLLVQPRTDRLRSVVVDSDDPTTPDLSTSAGRTRMAASALTDAVEDDIAALDGVRRVSAALSGHRDQPELWLRVVTDVDADLPRVRRHIATTVLADARASLDRPDLPAYLTLTVSGRSRSHAR